MCIELIFTCSTFHNQCFFHEIWLVIWHYLVTGLAFQLLWLAGTTICATNLFRNLPVRQQYHNAARRKKDELKSVETLLFSFSIIHPGVRFTLRHNKELIWQRIPLESSFQALQHVLGKAVTSQMEWNSCSFTDNVRVKVVVWVLMTGDYNVPVYF